MRGIPSNLAHAAVWEMMSHALDELPFRLETPARADTICVIVAAHSVATP